MKRSAPLFVASMLLAVACAGDASAQRGQQIYVVEFDIKVDAGNKMLSADVSDVFDSTSGSARISANVPIPDIYVAMAKPILAAELSSRPLPPIPPKVPPHVFMFLYFDPQRPNEVLRNDPNGS